MTFRAPTQAGLPAFTTIWDDLSATPQQIARHLGLSPVTLARYRAAQQAPRAVMLALFWETSWGRRTADIEAYNRAMTFQALSESLKRENAALRRHIDVLESELAQGCGLAANTPIYAIGAS